MGCELAKNAIDPGRNTFSWAWSDVRDGNAATLGSAAGLCDVGVAHKSLITFRT